jgi:hypothetical protein
VKEVSVSLESKEAVVKYDPDAVREPLNLLHRNGDASLADGISNRHHDG